MPTRPEVATFELDSSIFVHIVGRPGVELTCLHGCLWITQDGSAVDTELAGASPGSLRQCKVVAMPG